MGAQFIPQPLSPVYSCDRTGGFVMPVREKSSKHSSCARIRSVVTMALIVTMVLFFLPLLFMRGEPLYQKEDTSTPSHTHQPEATLPIDRVVTTGAAKDKGRPVRLKTTSGAVVELSMADYLFGVVAAEMPASFEPEALKAQACAARTYTVIRQGSHTDKHPDADICGDSRCCQAYITPEDAQARWGEKAQEYTQKIQQAVSGSDGLGILYEGQPIQALFFSSAAGKTVDAVEVWGNSVDYLKSVDSPEGDEVPNYHTQAVLSSQEVKSLLSAAYPSIDLSGDPGTWFGQASRNAGGGVISIPVGGVTLTGSQVRSVLSLRSACFAVSWDGSIFKFDVTGYGHGVGMSQYGANAMAKSGDSFRDILTWYYTGTQVDQLW